MTRQYILTVIKDTDEGDPDDLAIVRNLLQASTPEVALSHVRQLLLEKEVSIIELDAIDGQRLIGTAFQYRAGREIVSMWIRGEDGHYRLQHLGPYKVGLPLDQIVAKALEVLR